MKQLPNLKILKQVSVPNYKIKDDFFNKKCTFDFEVLTPEGSKQRILAVYNETLGKHVYFATNIPKDTLDAIQIGELYRSRWHVEISFRILKGNLLTQKV